MALRGYSICKRAESEIGARCNIHVRQQLRQFAEKRQVRFWVAGDMHTSAGNPWGLPFRGNEAYEQTHSRWAQVSYLQTSLIAKLRL